MACVWALEVVFAMIPTEFLIQTTYAQNTTEIVSAVTVNPATPFDGETDSLIAG
jgi:hypothetical protein